MTSDTSSCVWCCIAHKKKWKADFPDKSTTGSTSTSVFFTYDVPYFRHNSGVTSNRKVHHPAIESQVLSLHSSVAKRQQQFSCPLETATLSLKLENVVPSCWIIFVVPWPSVFLAAPPSISSTPTYCITSILKEISYDVTFFVALQQAASSKTHSIFLSTSLRFLSHVLNRLRRRRH